MSSEPATLRQYSHSALIAAGTIFLIHFALLGASIFDYRVTIDSAYHVSIARQWGEHWLVPWDQINFGPRGRPNLQGPLFQAAIGDLGRLLGGAGSDYVLADAVVSLAQWAAAILTAGFFALQLGGGWAALFAVSLLSGAGFASSSFAVGVPSGWSFIFIGWAISFFVRGRILPSAIATSLAVYVHVAGFAMAPLAILLAAALTRRWGGLVRVGLLTAVLTSPYSIHVLQYLDWFSNAQAHPAVLFDPLLDLLAAAGALMILRRPRDNPLLAAWLVAPLVWLLHDPCRLILQSGLAGGVAAGLMLADATRHIRNSHTAARLGCAIAAAATIFPLGVPALAAEVTWDLGLRYPRAIDWRQTSELATEIERAGLANRLIADYQPALCPALAVFGRLSCEKGHWVEVQARHDPADDLSAVDKAYILPLFADDPVLVETERRGWVKAYGSAGANTIVTLSPDLSPDAVARAVTPVIGRDSDWLGHNATNNTIDISNWPSLISSTAARRREVALQAQRVRAGRIELACLLYAASTQAANPLQARRLRRIAGGFGAAASFLSDGFAVDYISQTRLALFERSLITLALTAKEDPGAPDAELIAGLNDALAKILDMRSDSFAERPAGNLFPWMP